MLPRRSSRTSGNSRATMSGVPSGLPLSTTVTRISAAGWVLAQRAQAAPQQLFGAVADDDDLEVERLCHRRAAQ